MAQRKRMIGKKMHFNDFDFAALDSPNFKEDSVREELILPILHKLGYATSAQIVRSKTLQHPFVKIGSKKRPITLVPDYLLQVNPGTYAWVLDAKAPNENIVAGDNLEQIYSYAIHPEIRTKYFALCNGRAFSLFRQDSAEQNTPILYFELRDIAQHWEMLHDLLSVNSFQIGKEFSYTPRNLQPAAVAFDYLNRPLLEELPVKKQSVKRHFGVHGYFTKQSWNIVHEYIRNFTQAGDVVLDPFGGSGVTAIEALMCDRKGINIDLNPMPVFIVQALIEPVNLGELSAGFERVQSAYISGEPKSNTEIQNALTKYPFPTGIRLPKGSDVEFVENLFSDQQLAQLSFLKHLILQEKNLNVRNTLLLMFSGLLNKINLTYHASEGRSEGRGNSSVLEGKFKR